MNAGFISTVRPRADTSMPITLFTYGTLMRGKGNNYLLKDATFLGPAVSRRAKFAMRNVGFPIATEDGSHAVKGELFKVYDPGQLARVDSLEGHPTWYERKEFDFLLTNPRNGETNVIRAWMYVMPDRLARNRGHVVAPNEHGILVWPGAEM